MTAPVYGAPIHATMPPHCAHCGCGVRYAIDCVRVEGVIYCGLCAWRCWDCADIQLRPDSVPTRVRPHTRDYGRDYCESCASDAEECMRCGDLFAQGQLCGDCCPECEERIAEEGEERQSREADNIIGPYHNARRRSATREVPSPWTLRHCRWFGVEVEAESVTGDCVSSARAVLEAIHPQGVPADHSRDRLAWCEHDGSLNDGFEIITQPMGLDTHRDLWRVLDTRAVSALRSHDTETCGLHVHVSRSGLSSLTIAKAVVFLNSGENDTLITRLARRSGNGYCKRKHGAKVNCAAVQSFDRYERLNLTNSRTVEFRIFRGSLNRKTVLASVEFAHAVLEFCAQSSAAQLTAAAFVAWVFAPAQKADTAELRGLIARRMNHAMRAQFGHLLPVTNPRPVGV